MMPDAPGFAHARRADDDGRFLQIVERLRLVDFADVGQVRHAEGIRLFVQKPVDAVVEAFRVQAVNLRGVHAQGAVHENRHARQFARKRKLVQHIDNLLRASDGERRDDDRALLVQGLQHGLANDLVGVGARGVFASAVGGFNLQIIHVFDRHRIAENFIIAAAHVAAEQVPEFPIAFAHVQNHLRRTENMPGIAERDGHAVHNRERPLVTDGDELMQRFFRVGDGVKRFDRRKFFLRPLFGDEHGVVHLDVRRIHEHDAAKVARGERAMDVAGIALFDEVRQVARVIHVRVAQDNGINLLRVERKAAVALDGFLTVALEEAAFEQQPLAVDFEQIHRAGGGARRAEEVDLHQAIVLGVGCCVKKMAAVSGIMPLTINCGIMERLIVVGTPQRGVFTITSLRC